MKSHVTAAVILCLLSAAGGFASAAPIEPGLSVRHVVSATETIDNLTDANALLNGEFASSDTAVGRYQTINLVDPENSSGGNFLGDSPFPADTAADDNHFAVRVEGFVDVPEAGEWTFGVTADNGFRLILGGYTMSRSGSNDPSDVLGTFDLPAGRHPLTLTHYERTGDSGIEFYAARGDKADADDPDFRLVGDVANGGLAVAPEPGGFTGLTLIVLLCRRRRGV